MNEEKNLSEEIKINKEIFENINSPQIIQDILHLSTESSQIEIELQNNTIKSLLSINENLLPILDNDYNEVNFNPFILSQNKRNDLYRLNFEQINFTNNILKEKIEQYNELRQKINEFNNNKNNKDINNDKLNVENVEDDKKSEKELENQKKEEISKKLYLVNHPFISLFEKKININELKNEIKNEYLNKMKDNTKYKYLPPQNNNLLGFPLLLNDENIEEFDNDDNDDNDDANEDNEDNEDSNVISGSEDVESNELPEPILPPIAQLHGPVLPVAYLNQGNLNNDDNNNNGNNNDNNINNNNVNNNNDNDNNDNING